jgi:site-specific DNA-cytosine methylase
VDLSSKINGLDLFSGIGGISEALSPWVKTIAYCEIEPKSRAILLSRMFRGEIDNAPIWDDVFTLSGRHIDVPIDIISGGFPCTDISLAGLQKGLRADRSGLFWEIVRLTKEIAPSIIFLENVWPGVRKFVPTIRDQFESLGYAVRDGFLAASDVGAPHKRQRWFLVAYANQRGLLKQRGGGRRKDWKDSLQSHGDLEEGPIANAYENRRGIYEPKERIKDVHASLVVEQGDVANAKEERLQRLGLRAKCDESKQSELADILDRNDWNGLADFLCRIDNGVPLRRYARGALGDSVVPIQAREAFKVLSGL